MKLWSLEIFAVHNSILGLAFIREKEVTLIDKLLTETLFRAMIVNEVVSELVMEGLERDQTQKTLEIKTFTINDVMAPTKKVLDGQSLFQVLYLAFAGTAHLLNVISSRVIRNNMVLMRVQNGEKSEEVFGYCNV